MYALEELELGAVGIMTGFVYAELLVRLFDLARRKDWQQAAALFYDFVPLNRWEFQPGIGVSLRKQLLKRLGVFTSARVRHPGPEADPRTLDQLYRIVAHLREKGYDLAL
jgi:4-hydroxy-tetrahydrodipicolinate synthase